MPRPVPHPESLASLAGVTPSTRQSGKMKTTSFRWSADKQLRDAVCDSAADSRHANPWAEQLYRHARARGHRHPRVVRIVGRAWLHVIRRCWQDHQPYDPLSTARSRPSSSPQLSATLVFALRMDAGSMVVANYWRRVKPEPDDSWVAKFYSGTRSPHDWIEGITIRD